MQSPDPKHVYFKPHHFLCTLGFEGKGYSPEFVENFSNLVAQTRDGDHSTSIQVTFGSDSICTPCPNNLGNSCQTQEKISTLDEAHAKLLGLKEGDLVTWGEMKKLLAQKIDLTDFHRVCAPCSWKSMGVCEKALIRLKDQMREGNSQ